VTKVRKWTKAKSIGIDVNFRNELVIMIQENVNDPKCETGLDLGLGLC